MVHSKLPICRVHLFGYIFAPGLLPSVVTFLLLPLLLFLGSWQLDRAQFKQNLLLQYQQRLQAQPLLLQQVNSSWQNWRFYPLIISGHYDNDHSFLVDNKMYQHRPGYHVLTPFVVDDNRTLLINRGWIPLENRKNLPHIKPINGNQTITALIDIPARKPFLLSHRSESNAWPRRIEAIELEQLAKELHTVLYPVVLLLSPDEKSGYVRDWQPVTLTMPPARHIAYAVQWFSLAITLSIIFIIVNTKKANR